MPQRIEVPGMGIVEFPDGMTEEQIVAAIRQNMPQDRAELSPIAKALGNIGGGLVRGAGSIGATLLAPIDMARDAIAGKGLSLESNVARRKDMTDALASLGFNPGSMWFGAGKLLGEVGGTAGVGPLLGGAARMAGAGPAVVDALTTAGMSAGGLTGAKAVGIRAAAGGAVGAGAAGLVNPEDAGTGAMIGAAMPGALQLAGKAGAALARPFRSPESKAAATLLDAIEQDPEHVAARLRSAKTIVRGSDPTVAQVMRTPQASTLERIVSESAGGASLKQRYAAQNAARMAALDSVAPIDPRGFRSAQDDMGTAALKAIIEGDDVARAKTTAAYQAIPQDEAVLYLPDLEAIRDQYFPRGAFGGRDSVDQAVRVAKDIGFIQIPGATKTKALPQKVTFREFDALRKSIGNAQRAARQNPDRATEALALSKMKAALDDRINEVVRGDGAVHESLPLAWADQLTEAQNLKRTQAEKFRTGPQSLAFRTGSDGLPAVQGGEFAAKVWGNRPGIAQDITQFRKVIDDHPDLLGQFKSMITTEGASTASAGGNLTNKFVRWVDNSLPGLKATFDPKEVKALQRIADDIKRANITDALGMAKGSPTYQNASNALSLGLLDNPLLKVAANRIPIVNQVSGPLLDALRNSARASKARTMADLLSDPANAALTIEGLLNPGRQYLDVQRGLLIAAPVVGSQ